MEVEEVAKYLKGKKKALVMSGEFCNKIKLGEKKLLDYAVEVASKIDAPIAATGNTVKAIKELRERRKEEKEKVKTKKIFAAEIPFYAKYNWREELSEKPDVIVMIGYSSEVSKSIITALDSTNVETVSLDNKKIKEATASFSDLTIEKWKDTLEILIDKL